MDYAHILQHFKGIANCSGCQDSDYINSKRHALTNHFGIKNKETIHKILQNLICLLSANGKSTQNFQIPKLFENITQSSNLECTIAKTFESLKIGSDNNHISEKTSFTPLYSEDWEQYRNLSIEHFIGIYLFPSHNSK